MAQINVNAEYVIYIHTYVHRMYIRTYVHVFRDTYIDI